VRGAEAARHLEPAVVQVDQDDLRRRIELGREQRGQADGPGAHDGHRAAGRDLAVEHAALEAGRQDVAEHHQRLFVRACGNRVEAGVRMRNAHVLGLRAVDGVAQDPAAGGAVRIHAAAAVLALAARRDARDEHVVAGVERGHAGADGLDDAHALVPEDAARRAARHIALEDVQVGAADGRLADLDDGVARRLDLGLGMVFERFEAGAPVYECFHGSHVRPRCAPVP
jgi:hypothetical protein